MTQKNNLASFDVHNLTLSVLCQLPLVARVARGAYIFVPDMLNVVIFAASRSYISQPSECRTGSEYLGLDRIGRISKSTS